MSDEEVTILFEEGQLMMLVIGLVSPTIPPEIAPNEPEDALFEVELMLFSDDKQSEINPSLLAEIPALKLVPNVEKELMLFLDEEELLIGEELSPEIPAA